MNDTIAAIASPLAQGAISIIKVSGDQAIEKINRIFDRDLSSFQANTINYGNIQDPNSKKIIDEVMISVFKGPMSFTREDVIEINTHGGVLVTRTVLSLVLAQGIRLARPGEFTQRAFLNGRLDLTQAEAINDLVIASSSKGMELAVSGIKGSIKKLLDPLISDMLDIIAQIEVNIDYPEYDDVQQLSNEVVLPKVNEWLKQLDVIIEKALKTREIKEGVKTVIIGEPNVGKSSLFNALIEEDKAIVTDIAGTTRDLVEGIIHLDKVTLSLIDTAGLRDTEDKIEKIGIEKTNEAISKAEFVILVLDASREINNREKELLKKIQDKRHLVVYNKSDLKDRGSLQVSAIRNDVKQLVEEVNSMFEYAELDLSEGSLNNERQIGLAMQARDNLNQAIIAIESELELDLVTIDLNEAYMSLKEILGEVSRDDLLDTLFSKFCLGK